MITTSNISGLDDNVHVGFLNELGNLFSGDYDKSEAIYKATNEGNRYIEEKNELWSRFSRLWSNVPLLKAKETEIIWNIYANIQLASDKVFTTNKHYSVFEFTKLDTAPQKELIKEVARLSQHIEEKVEAALTGFYRLVKEGEINGRWIDPRSFEKRKKRDDNPDGDWSTTESLKYAAYGLIAIAGLYGLSQVVKVASITHDLVDND